VFPVDEIKQSPEEAFILASELLIKYRRVFALSIFFKPGTEHCLSTRKAFDIAWAHKSGYKGGQKLTWGHWLAECIFPEILYKANGKDLLKLMADPRFYDEPSFHKKTTYHSHIGRMARPRKACNNTDYIGYLDYTIDRWRRDNHKSMPHFYFDVESPEWMFEELFKNPNQIKSGRTAVSCTGNFSFRWDSKNKRPVLFQILKHSQYSHLFGDFCGTAAFMRAFCKELKLDVNRAVVCLFAVSISMDGLKQAKQFIKEVQGDDEA